MEFLINGASEWHGKYGDTRSPSLHTRLLDADDIKFSTAVGLIRLHRPSIKKSQAKQRLARHHMLHANQWYHLWEIQPTIAVKRNFTNVNVNIKFVVNIFHCHRIVFTAHTHTILKLWGSALQAQHLLMMGIARGQFPLFVKGHHATKQWEEHLKWLSLQAPYLPFIWRILTFKGWNDQLRPICQVLSQFTQACANSTSNPSA